MKIERNVELPKKRIEVPQKTVRHSYAIPSRVLVGKVKELDRGDSFLVETPNHSTSREMQRRLAGAIGGSYLKSNKVLFGKRFAIRQVSGGVRVWRKK
jgi:hypothetical protein